MDVKGRSVKPVEEIVIEKLLQSINRSTVSREGEIHVSSLCYPCIRRSFYIIRHGQDFFNTKTLLTFWIGRELHKTPILSGNEISLEWEGIKGTCDEFENGLLIEKKTCTQIPNYPSSQHITQAEYYSVLLKHAKKPVSKACILYIDIMNKRLKAFPVKLRSTQLVEQEMLNKKLALEESIKTSQPPPRKISWLCDHCTFASECFRDGHYVK